MISPDGMPSTEKHSCCIIYFRLELTEHQDVDTEDHAGEDGEGDHNEADIDDDDHKTDHDAGMKTGEKTAHHTWCYHLDHGKTGTNPEK